MLHRNLESSLHVVTLAKSYVNVTRGYTLGVTCSEGVWVCVSLDGAEVYEVVLRTYEQSYAYRVDRVRRVDRVILYDVSGCSRASRSWDVRRDMASVRQ